MRVEALNTQSPAARVGLFRGRSILVLQQLPTFFGNACTTAAKTFPVRFLHFVLHDWETLRIVPCHMDHAKAACQNASARCPQVGWTRPSAFTHG